ncbi:uncharacterized protein LOC118186450 [Stegodyphus dumicola]|uniref:uncharacterized protein LOC118186450 n=1 Tax=Stegodyphus dumicola TaxID=202533 RepID=UPI0015B0EE88|nr:uncharacterized protein LOC118186450 [Stegodyphus dumicola]
MTTSISNTNADTAQTRENDIHKPPSEDSGITRGDQISSEATAEPTPSVLPSTENPVPPSPVKRNRKERRSRHSHSKNCRRHSRRSQEERSAALKRGQCDEYYDGLTGARRFHKGRHSDSWTSDLSWEEKELLRRLRSRRGTVRSNAPSARSARSHQWKQDEGHFHRPQPFRRSVSDESTFFGSSVCSCDDCWAFFMKDYAYGRASLRGIPATQELCTCRMVRPDFLGRRVQFRSETIHEASQSERTVTTPTMTENKDGGTEDDVTSNLSAKKKDEEPQKLPNGITEKKSKTAEENYRFVTPWELEEWDLAMKRHLLHRRRRRARCMGIMALAMVVFIGLVVAVVMIYLRRKVI